MDVVKRAIAVAFEKHQGQTRMITNAPYVVHVLEVAKLLLYESVSDEVLAAGILHDTIEDTSYTQEELTQDFGDKIAQLVLFCTEPENDEKKSGAEMRDSWKRRKQHTIDACKTASKDELMLALADKLANITSVREDMIVQGETVWDHFDSTKTEQEWYYRSLADIFIQRLPESRLLKIYISTLGDVFL